MKKILLPLLLLGLSIPSYAEDLLPQQSPGFFGQKTRNLGMGNVGVSILGTVDSSAFYNPAGLNDLTKEDAELRFLTISAGISNNAFWLINDVSDLVGDIDDAVGQADRVRVLNDFITERTGEFQHVDVGMELVSYTKKNFATGLLFNEQMDLSFRDQSFPHFDIRNLGDAGAYVAFSTGFWEHLLQMGMTFKPLMRFSLDEEDQTVTYGDVVIEDAEGDPVLIDQFKNIWDHREFVMPVNVGVKSDLSFGFWDESYFIETLKPQLGVTWDDIGSPSFAPLTTQQQTVNVGFSINPLIWRIKTLFALEFREINWDRPLLSKLHIGTEWKFPWIVAVRAGLSQGYATGGLTADLKIFKIDAAIYYQEIGFFTREHGDLRFATTLGFKI